MSADDDWLDALAGRKGSGDGSSGDARARAEGALLRTAQRRWPASLPAELAAIDAAGEAALLARARAAGLLGDRPRRWFGCTGCAERWARWTRAWPSPLRSPWSLSLSGALALTLVAWLVLPVAPPLDGPAPETVLRAGADGIVLIRDTDPVARRDRIAAALTGAGADVTRYERLGRAGLDATLPTPLRPALTSVLRAQALAAPADGVLRVEVEAAP